MVFAKIYVTGTCARATELKELTSGLAGGKIMVDYDDHIWAGLSKTVVFRGISEKDALTGGPTVEIPWEVVEKPCKHLWVGFYGTDSDKNMIIPTVYADLGPVLPGADPSGDESTDPSLPVWAQLQNQIDDLKGNESPGGNGSGENGGYYTPSVKQPDSDTLQFNFAPSKANMPAIKPVEVELPAGPKGDDYVLTPADKAEIAEIAADLVEIPDSGGNVDLDTTLTQSGKAADAKAVGDKIAEISGISLVEPAEDDIPKVFFGGALQQTKDEAVVPFRYISKTQDVSGYAKIKAQGRSSMNYPKKNQTVKMFKDAECTEKMKVDFKGWGKQNKHCYKANWIDLTHARNVVSARLWGDVVKSRANYAELPELLRTSPNQGAVDGFPIKVYANGVYQGRYTLNIPKDAWMANMDDELDEHCILCGEGYVSGCFREASVGQWTDEVHDSMPTAIRTRWLEIINFVMNSTDEEFKTNLGNYFDVESLLDYHLFGLASCGLDAYGINQLYMTYDGQKWFASMYDMDSTWGLWVTGAGFMETDYDRSEYQDFKDGDGNLLYIRLENLFYEELQARWTELRSGALSIENIINRFERFTDIASSQLVQEDYASTTGGGEFTGIPAKITNTIQQIRGYAVARHAWCDTYVANLSGGGEVNPDEPDEPDVPENVPCTGVTLSASTLTFTGIGSQTLVATVEPVDTTDSVVWSVDPSGIATVSDGVVTAVSNGSCTITASCGEYSASCSVSVTGVSDNLLSGINFTSGFLSGSTGLPSASTNEVHSSEIPLSDYAGRALSIDVSNSDGVLIPSRIHWYGDDGKQLSYTYISESVIVPQNINHGKFNISTVKGTEIDIAVYTGGNDIFSTLSILSGQYYSYNTGELQFLEGYNSAKIPVIPNTEYFFTGLYSYIFVTGNDVYISGAFVNAIPGSVIIPENCEFMCISWKESNEQSVSFKESVQIGHFNGAV